MCVCACANACARGFVCGCVCVYPGELFVRLIACVRKWTRKCVRMVCGSSPSRNLSRTRAFSFSLEEGETRFQGYRKILSRYIFSVSLNLRFDILDIKSKIKEQRNTEKVILEMLFASGVCALTCKRVRDIE